MAREVGDDVYYPKKSDIFNGQIIRIIRECGIITNLIGRIN